MSRPDKQIWQITTEMPNKQPLQVYRSQKIGARAVQITDKENRGVLAIWMTLQLLNDQHLSSADSVSEKVLRLVPGRKKGLVFDTWNKITSFAIGDNNSDIFSPLNAAANYALCLKDRPITRGLFKVAFHPDVLVQAVLHGDETMVRNMLKMNPDLTQKGEGIDFSGRQFTKEKNTALTALQAAMAAADFAPNQNSTGLFELLFDELKRQCPNNCYQILRDQALELYTKSLYVYAQKQADKIRALTEKKDKGEAIDETALKTAKERQAKYLLAIQSNDLTQIINAHTNPDPNPNEAPDAQKDHAFEVSQTLIDAIANASDADIQAVLNDPTIESPLSNLLKQFRSDFTKLSHEEIIHNPQHLLKMFAAYHAFYARVEHTDPNWKKRDLFWCHLVGFVQRYVPANVAQVFANPGLYDTVENGSKNQRSFDFKYDGGSIFPLSFDSNSGLGYKFARRRGRRRCVGGLLAAAGARCAFRSYADPASFQNLLRNHCVRMPTSLNVHA